MASTLTVEPILRASSTEKKKAAKQLLTSRAYLSKGIEELQ